MPSRPASRPSRSCVPLATGKAAQEIDRAHLAQRLGVAARIERGGEPAGAFERLLGAAELCQQARTAGLEKPRHLGEATLLTEGDALLEVGERAGRPLERIAGDGEVVLQTGGIPASSPFDEQGKRFLRLGEAVAVAEEGAGVSSVAECAGRLG